ncbi:hypothetical protein WISP_118443 [Willisornis vidua]|uniref:Uncharacterized protein n=1 Tax=Willisornis vidua TaxID=1566151 RepID=A0ABQ9CW41_9PASS|nr:hypothetical protein WISP_118443 [Willisornis vidua]
MGLVLQSLHQPHCPSLDPLQHLNILPKLRDPELDTALKVWPHQCRVQGKTHFPGAAGHTIPDTGQDPIGLLGLLGTLLVMFSSLSSRTPRSLSAMATVQPLCPQPVVLQGVVAKVQDPALGLELHTVGFGQSLQPIQVILQSPPAFHQIDTLPSLTLSFVQ